MKRVLGILMVCALLIAGLTTFVSANAVSIDIAADKASLAVGEVVTATITLNDYTPESWSAMTIAVGYDDDYLRYEGAVSGLNEDIEMVVEARDGKVFLCWIAEALPAPEAGYLAKLQFTATAETSALNISSAFIPGGVASKGETDPVDNSNGDVFDAGVVETPKIEVAPEAPIPPVAPSEKVVTTNKEPDNKAEFDAVGKYITVDDVDNYKIVITWSETEYVYSNGGREWDPADHKWLQRGEAAWVGDGTVTVENHSSQDVTALFNYEALDNNTVMTFTQSDVEIPAEGIVVSKPAITEGEEVTPAGKEVVRCVMDGTIDNEEVSQIGTITVTIK